MKSHSPAGLKNLKFGFKYPAVVSVRSFETAFPAGSARNFVKGCHANLQDLSKLDHWVALKECRHQDW